MIVIARDIFDEFLLKADADIVDSSSPQDLSRSPHCTMELTAATGIVVQEHAGLCEQDKIADRKRLWYVFHDSSSRTHRQKESDLLTDFIYNRNEEKLFTYIACSLDKLGM